MKLNGVFGKGTGKVGNSVWAVSGGVQIVRPYNPNVTNPRTDAQVAQRAKLKLMSQLAAVLAPGIAFKKKGLVSARNQFVSANIGNVTFVSGAEENSAQINMSRIDLTGGSRSLPSLTHSQFDTHGGTLSLSGAAAEDIKAVVYVLCEYSDEEKISLVDVIVSNTPGEGRTFEAQAPAISAAAFALGYGVISADSATLDQYLSYYVIEGAPTGVLDVISKLATSGAIFTETKGVNIQ